MYAVQPFNRPLVYSTMLSRLFLDVNCLQNTVKAVATDGPQNQKKPEVAFS